jgi:ribosome recycling factor
MASQTLFKTEEKMQKSIEGLKKELAGIRTGRASPALVEHLKADYAGVLTPLNQMAGIAAPDPKMLVIQPWDKTTIKNIVQAIQASDLGLNPNSDGNVIRISIPPLSEERRQELTKAVHKRIEERRVIIRNFRHEALDELKKSEQAKELSEDEYKRDLAQLQKLTDKYIAAAELVGKEKETELLKF